MITRDRRPEIKKERERERERKRKTVYRKMLIKDKLRKFTILILSLSLRSSMILYLRIKMKIARMSIEAIHKKRFYGVSRLIRKSFDKF
jgi:hypothetical protein